MTDPIHSLYRAIGRAMPLGLRRRLLYAKTHRRWPRLDPPRTFTEKVNWRILNDRREVLSWTCDKLAMKDYAARVAPSIRVPRTLWSGTDLAELAAMDLPERWVLKPNHRSKAVHLGRGQPDLGALERATRDWMEGLQGEGLGEWAYTRARQLYLCEEFIGSGDVPPADYKFLVFDGEVAVVQVDYDRFDGHGRHLYTPEWESIDVKDVVPLAPREPQPARLADMLAAAATLGAGFDFVRIDLYHVNGEIYFGETTPYPAGGLKRFTPRSFDRELGDRWRLPDLTSTGR